MTESSGQGWFAEIDITDWLPGPVEPLGSKPKQWTRDPAGQLWLFKETTFNRGSDGAGYRKGDDWAEKVACEVATRLGLPTAQVELAVRREEDRVVYGVISKKMLSDAESLIHGNELLAEIGVVGMSPRDRTGYTLDAVDAVLEDVDPPRPGGSMSALELWAGYLVLDALIGNTDRHQENWGVIAGDRRRLAPTFDHASSLGFLLDDAERAERLEMRDRNRTVAAFAERAHTTFQGRPHPCDIAADGLSRISSDAGQLWLVRAAELTGIDPILAALPTHRATQTARQFASALFAHNRARLVAGAL